MVGTAILGSIVVSISACHAEDRGSIPRRGEVFFYGEKRQKAVKDRSSISLLPFPLPHPLPLPLLIGNKERILRHQSR